jgi:glycerol transport system ATP-binding protein
VHPFSHANSAHANSAHAKGEAIAVKGKVLICEISGSESVVHFNFAGTTWVSLAHGVQPHAVGEDAPFALDTARCLYFGADGRRLAA